MSLTLNNFKIAIETAAFRPGAVFAVTLHDIEALGWPDFRMAVLYASELKVEVIIIPDREYLRQNSKKLLATA